LSHRDYKNEASQSSKRTGNFVQNYFVFISLKLMPNLGAYILGGRKLSVFENRALRRIFRPKRDEVTREWRKVHNKELNHL